MQVAMRRHTSRTVRRTFLMPLVRPCLRPKLFLVFFFFCFFFFLALFVEFWTAGTLLTPPFVRVVLDDLLTESLAADFGAVSGWGWFWRRSLSALISCSSSKKTCVMQTGRLVKQWSNKQVPVNISEYITCTLKQNVLRRCRRFCCMKRTALSSTDECWLLSTEGHSRRLVLQRKSSDDRAEFSSVVNNCVSTMGRTEVCN